VGCPYCKRVVTAPRSSTWPPAEIPMASPARSAFEVPPPPPGQVQAFRPAPAAATYAPWAMTLAIACAVLSMIGWLVFMGSLLPLAEQRVGRNASEEQKTEAAREIMLTGQAGKPPLAIAALAVGVLCGLGGLVLAVRSLVRQETRRAMAVIACIVSVCFLCCQVPLMILMLAKGATANG